MPSTPTATDPLTGPYSQIRVFREGYCQVAVCRQPTDERNYVLCQPCARAMTHQRVDWVYTREHGQFVGLFVHRCEELATIWGRWPW